MALCLSSPQTALALLHYSYSYSYSYVAGASKQVNKRSPEIPNMNFIHTVFSVKNSSLESSWKHCSGSGQVHSRQTLDVIAPLKIQSDSATWGRSSPGNTLSQTACANWTSTFIDFKYSRLSFHGVERENKFPLPECQNKKLL